MSPSLTLFDLAVDADALADCHRLLDADERTRAAAFRFTRDRARFVARRGMLRRLLGELTGIAPAALRFTIGAFGKPALLGADLHFNLSHSDGLALCATAATELGCDIERCRADRATPGVAARFFSRAENAALAALPPAQWVEGFFNCWTRKEAYLKARGTGLSEPLDAFSVSLAPGDPPQLTDVAPGWTICAPDPAPGYTAAVVARVPFDGVPCRRVAWR